VYEFGVGLVALSNRSDCRRRVTETKKHFHFRYCKAREEQQQQQGRFPGELQEGPVNPFPKRGHIMKTEVNSVRLLIIIFTRWPFLRRSSPRRHTSRRASSALRSPFHDTVYIYIIPTRRYRTQLRDRRWLLVTFDFIYTYTHIYIYVFIWKKNIRKHLTWFVLTCSRCSPNRVTSSLYCVSWRSKRAIIFFFGLFLFFTQQTV